MLVRLLSDLHFEFEEESETRDFIESLQFDQTGCTTCVLAGDIATLPVFDRLAVLCETWPDVDFYWVAGNHEYYGSSFAEVNMARYRMCHEMPNLHSLDRVLTSDDIVGATLWYPPPGNDLMRMWMRWSDTNYVRDAFNIFYEAGKDWSFLRERAREARAVVTHMLPGYHVVTDEYRHSETNVFFVHDCSDIIGISPSVKTWMFGHTHTHIDKVHHGVRFVCNPRGYPRRERGNNGFDPLFEVVI